MDELQLLRIAINHDLTRPERQALRQAIEMTRSNPLLALLNQNRITKPDELWALLLRLSDYDMALRKILNNHVGPAADIAAQALGKGAPLMPPVPPSSGQE